MSLHEKLTKEEFLEALEKTQKKDMHLIGDSQEVKQFTGLKDYKHYYDNSKGSLYQFAEDQKLNCWEFDIIKRVVRCRKKGNFIQDLEKTKFLIDLYLKENEGN